MVYRRKRKVKRKIYNQKWSTGANFKIKSHSEAGPYNLYNWYCEGGHQWVSRITEEEKYKNIIKCPLCKLVTESKIHDHISSKYQVVYQPVFKWCKSEKTCNFYPFDFYLPEHNLIIEFDGGQHFGDCGDMKHSILRDVEKMVYAWKNGTRILRISCRTIYIGRYIKGRDSKISKDWKQRLDLNLTKAIEGNKGIYWMEHQDEYGDHKLLLKSSIIEELSKI